MYKQVIINCLIIVFIVYITFTLSLAEFNFGKWEHDIKKMFFAFSIGCCIIGNRNNSLTVN